MRVLQRRMRHVEDEARGTSRMRGEIVDGFGGHSPVVRYLRVVACDALVASAVGGAPAARVRRCCMHSCACTTVVLGLAVGVGGVLRLAWSPGPERATGEGEVRGGVLFCGLVGEATVQEGRDAAGG